MNISVTITLTYFKFEHITLRIYMEGKVSQIFYIGPSFYFMEYRKTKQHQKPSRFLTYNKSYDLYQNSETPFPPYIDVLYMWLTIFV